jgi:hypothetical protein
MLLSSGNTRIHFVLLKIVEDRMHGTWSGLFFHHGFKLEMKIPLVLKPLQRLIYIFNGSYQQLSVPSVALMANALFLIYRLVLRPVRRPMTEATCSTGM